MKAAALLDFDPDLTLGLSRDHVKRCGNEIRRLYGAGELGSIWGFLYESGGNLGECLASGRMAGLHVASEVPLT